MQVDNGMTPRRSWAVFRPWERERRTGLAVPSLEFLTAATVFAAVVFNFALAALNANALSLGRGHVILTEVFIVGAAIAICARSPNRLMIPWGVVLWALAMIFIILSIFRQSIEPKYFRDVLLIPVFIALGTTFAKGNVIRLFVTLQVTVLAIMIFEGLSPGMFGNVVNPFKYYINTREYTADRFWNPESLLYVSAFRPHGRFFEWLDVHRLSSIFLEPVSLGNWCVVITIFLVTFWRELSTKVLVFFIVSNILILIGSDGRLATLASLLILTVSIFSVKLPLPRYLYILYLPASLITTIILVAIFEPNTYTGFLGRLNFSTLILSKMDFLSVLGLDAPLAGRSEDSGISYFILTQSIFGVSILWASLCLLQPATNRMVTVFIHSICIYVSLVLMISFSMFSIKTAAPLWFLYGYVRARSSTTA